jgi:predicted transcriptional regulator of viral defense system
MVVTSRQMQPSVITIAGNEIQFVYYTFQRFFGYDERWVTNQEQAMVSDLEKTIVDAVSKPQLSGGIIEIGKAIYRSKERTDLQKLFYYLARNMSHAAKKRYLFLSDVLEMEWTSEHDRMLKYSGSSISLLDPSGSDLGIINSRFGLKINIEVKLLQQRNFGR